MSLKYELRPADKSPTLNDLLVSTDSTAVKLVSPDLSEVAIDRVDIDVTKRCWHVYLNCESLDAYAVNLVYIWDTVRGSVDLLKDLNLVFKDRSGGMVPGSASFTGDIIPWLNVHLPQLLEQFRLENAHFSSLLAHLEWEIREDSDLVIYISHGFGIERLKAKGFIESLTRRIKALGGPTLNISLKIKDFSEESKELEAQFEKEEAALYSELAKVDGKGIGSSDGVIIGKRISKDPVSIVELTEEENNVVILGEIFECETRVLKSGKYLLTGAITDYTDSVNFKLFGETAQKASELLKPGMWVTLKGNLEQDRFSNDELVLNVSDINRGDNPYARMDTSEEKRVELHLHTKMSAMDSTVETKDIVKLAAKWGHRAIAITDHGVVHDFPAANAGAKGTDLKILYGVEGYLINDPSTKDRPYHIIIIAKNKAGLTNLYRIVSESHTKYFYRHPRVPRALLDECREGLIIGSACESGELFQAMVKGADDDTLINIAQYYDYLEIQPLGNNQFMVREGLCKSEEDLKGYNRRIIALGERLGKLVVATGDVHFQDPKDSYYRQLLMASQGYSDADKQAPLYFRTTEEMLAEFSYLGAEKAREVVIINPNAIADEIEKMSPVPSDFAPPIIDGAEDEIRQMSYEKAHEMYGDPLPDPVKARLELELNSIIGHGYAVLYSIAQKLVSRSISDGYVVGSRGSVGSSFVATMCGITEVNPLPPHYRCPKCKYSEFLIDAIVGTGVDLPEKVCPECGEPLIGDGQDIFFATFMGFDGDKEPDIDLNFSGEYQPEAHRFVEELFGAEFIYRVGTIATLADKTVYGFVKKFLDEKGARKRNCEINRLIKGCVGVRKSTGQHPGGLVVVPRNRNIYEFTPVQYPANNPEKGKCITHFDFHSALESRLVKLDILGHDDPTMIHRLKHLTGIDPTTVPLNDPKVMSLFSSVEALRVDKGELNLEVGTWGIPEFNTPFTQQMLEVIRPQNFAELIYVSGFSHGTGVWLGNALELIQSETAKINEVISVRDCIMTDLIRKGMPSKQSFMIMEKVRKGKGLTDEEVQAMADNNVPEWYIDSCKKIQYLFPKAHAVAYVTMAVRIAFFKVYYPEAFYAAYFSIRADDFDANLAVKGYRTVKDAITEIEQKGREASVKEKSTVTDMQLAMEAQLRGIEFLPVDVESSMATAFEIVGKGKLRCPLGSLKGLGESAAKAIVDARREGPFLSVEDLKIRSGISSAVIEILREHGCLNGWHETSQMSLF